jgi:hypothetical protein
VWDFDRSLGTPYDPRATEPEEWNQTFNARDYFNEGWWRLLFRDPDFRSRLSSPLQGAVERGNSRADNLDRIDTAWVETGNRRQVGDAGRPKLPPLGAVPTREGHFERC